MLAGAESKRAGFEGLPQRAKTSTREGLGGSCRTWRRHDRGGTPGAYADAHRTAGRCVKQKTPIDWKAAHDRMDEARRRTAELASPAADRQRVFRQRAESFAQQKTAPEARGTAIVIFRSGLALFGIPLESVREVLTDTPIAMVPGAPASFAGVIQIRGEIRPVIHLARRLGLPGGGGAEGQAILLLRHGGREIGVLTDHVEDIRMVTDSERSQGRVEARHVDWVTRDMVTVLNLDSLLEGID